MTEGPSRSGVSRLLPMVVLVVLVVAALGTFVVTRSVMRDQERRLLGERADEVAALVSNSIGSTESSLRVLGAVGASRDRAAIRLFSESARPLVRGDTATVGVAAERDDGFEVVTTVGDGPAAGEPLNGDRAALASRALAEEQLVSALVKDAGGTRLVLAVPAGSGRAVAYQESALDPTTPVPSTPESPFRELRVALYASSRPHPNQLVLTTEADMPLSSPVEQVPFEVGADRWLLVVGARGPLAGSFARDAPWFLLGGGLVAALLAAAVAVTLARRRAYALALVTERTGELEQAHGELAETRAFLDRMLTAGPALVSRATLADQRVTYVSSNIERLFGLTEAEVLAPGFLAQRTHPDSLPGFGAALGRLAEGVTEREILEYPFLHGDGTYRWISVDLAAEADDTGRPAAVLAYVMDIDDRRQADEARREAQEAAERANRAKSEFLSRMSHELRTPLNAILGFGQLLEMERLEPGQEESVQQILKGGRHLLDLINEVLDIARIESGRLTFSLEPIALAEALREALDLIRPLAAELGIEVKAGDSWPPDRYVEADRQRLKQVLLNLLSNAVKYNRPGGSVTVRCAEVPGDGLRIEVTDEGPGIPSEMMERLFVPFDRLGAEGTGVEGTGLGLALSKRLMEAMGGTLGVDSVPGRGSTFLVEMPLSEAPGASDEPELAGHLPSGSGRAHTLLYIEDNMANLKLIERALAFRPDLGLLSAMQGSLGLDLARQHQPDLVLLDLHLPDISGEELLRHLQADPRTRDIPVIVISADATPGRVQRLLAAGARAYLTKPLDMRRFFVVVNDALEEQRLDHTG